MDDNYNSFIKDIHNSIYLEDFSVGIDYDLEETDKYFLKIVIINTFIKNSFNEKWLPYIKLFDDNVLLNDNNLTFIEKLIDCLFINIEKYKIENFPKLISSSIEFLYSGYKSLLNKDNYKLILKLISIYSYMVSVNEKNNAYDKVYKRYKDYIKKYLNDFDDESLFLYNYIKFKHKKYFFSEFISTQRKKIKKNQKKNSLLLEFTLSFLYSEEDIQKLLVDKGENENFQKLVEIVCQKKKKLINLIKFEKDYNIFKKEESKLLFIEMNEKQLKDFELDIHNYKLKTII